MSIHIDLLQSFTLGLVGFFCLPLIAGALPWERSKGLIGTYHSIAMGLLGRALLVKRSHGGLTIKKSRFEPPLGEKVSIAKGAMYFKDPQNFMSTFRGYPFGIVHEDYAAIVDARTAFFGRRFADLHSRNEWERNGMFKAYFAVEAGLRTLVNIDDVKPVVQQSGAPELVERLDTFGEKAQALFNSNKLIQQTAFFMALGVGVGVMWMIRELGGDASGSEASRLVDIALVPGVFT